MFIHVAEWSEQHGAFMIQFCEVDGHDPHKILRQRAVPDENWMHRVSASILKQYLYSYLRIYMISQLKMKGIRLSSSSYLVKKESSRDRWGRESLDLCIIESWCQYVGSLIWRVSSVLSKRPKTLLCLLGNWQLSWTVEHLTIQHVLESLAKEDGEERICSSPTFGLVMGEIAWPWTVHNFPEVPT